MPKESDAATPRAAEGEDENEGGFLGRWSRRKAEARRADPEPPGPSSAKRDSPTTQGQAPAVAPEPAPGMPDLPDIESLTAESDFRVFMGQGVPDDVRNQALRKLWRLKPSLANLDGLVDYGHDYTRGAIVVAGLKTAYQVGKGYLERIEVPDERQVAAADSDAAGPASEDVASEPGDAPPGDAPVPEDSEGAPGDQPEAPIAKPARSG